MSYFRVKDTFNRGKAKGKADFDPKVNQRTDENTKQQDEIFLQEIKSNLNIDMEFARRHAIANKIGIDDPNQEPFYCPCCHKNCNKIDFGLNCDIDDLSTAGLGVTLYFKMIEALRKLMFVIVLIHALPSLIYNLVFGTFCRDYDSGRALAENLCRWSIFTAPSFANKIVHNNAEQEKKYGWQVSIDTLTFYVLLIMLFKIRLDLTEQCVKLRGKRGHDVNDFSIFVENFPKLGTKRLTNLIYKFFERLNYANGINYEVKRVSHLFDTRAYKSLKESKEVLQIQINKMTENDPYLLNRTNNMDVLGLSAESANKGFAEGYMNDNERPSNLNDYKKVKKLKKMREKRSQKELELQEITQNIQDFEYLVSQAEDFYVPIYTRKAFLTFQTYGASLDLLDRYSEEFLTTKMWRKLKKLGILGLEKPDKTNKLEFELKELIIYPAVHPSNLIWENLAISKLEKSLRRFLVLMICIGLSVACSVALRIIVKAQIEYR